MSDSAAASIDDLAVAVGVAAAAVGVVDEDAARFDASTLLLESKKWN